MWPGEFHDMKKLNILLAILISSLMILSFFSTCLPTQRSRLKVVTTTSLLAYVVQQVGGDRVEVVSIVPAAQHPGDFAAKPQDIQKLADANLFLTHNWPGEQFVPGLIASASNAKLTVLQIDVPGNWMIPSVQMAATDMVAAALSQVDNQNNALYQQSAAAYKARIVAKEAAIKPSLTQANLPAVRVVSVDGQASFVTWTGLNLIATYGTPESLTSPVVKDLVDKGRAVGVTLVVDNLQNGRDAGKELAAELGARRIILSNFPGGFDDTGTWEKAFDRNIELILGAIAR